MENGLQIFENSEFGKVRIISMEDNALWFVAKDILNALEYADGYNAARAVQHIPDEWKGVQPIHTPGGTQEMLTLSEQGLYFFLGRSDKPKALPYQRWIAGEVLPSIRKTGGYMRVREDDTPELIIARAVILAQETIKRIETQNKQLKKKIAIDAPKVEFAESLSVADTVISVGELAKLIYQSGREKIGQNRLFEWMRDNGYLHKYGTQYNLPTQKSIEMGIMSIKESTRKVSKNLTVIDSTTKVTAKGQMYFMNKFPVEQ